jgi:biotin-dependent carboxylase-like uncharacterized protein
MSGSPAAPPPPATAVLRVLEPGLFTLVVDDGRPGTRSLGVPVGGAADRTALALGNALVGNPAPAAALEITLAGPTLRSTGELACVVFGAPFALTGDKHSAPFTAGKTFALAPGQQLRIGSTSRRMRAYLCVRGGLLVPAVLGSLSGLEPLRAGAELRCLPGRIPARFLASPLAWERDPSTLRVLEGPQADWFQGREFYPQGFTVSSASNRMGLRLQGQPLTLPGREVASEPVCPGAVQVTSDGQCIILGVDGHTIGGYPKIAQVISADLDKLGQLRPGEAVRFVRVDQEAAQALYRQKQAEIRQWLLRLRLTLGGC